MAKAETMFTPRRAYGKTMIGVNLQNNGIKTNLSQYHSVQVNIT